MKFLFLVFLNLALCQSCIFSQGESPSPPQDEKHPGTAIWQFWKSGESLPFKPYFSIENSLKGHKMDGIVIGLVSDQSNNPIPGISVYVDGPSMQGVRMINTNTQGQFLFIQLPNGEYRFTFEGQEFEKLEKSGIRVETGKATVVQATLAPAGTKVITITFCP